MPPFRPPLGLRAIGLSFASKEEGVLGKCGVAGVAGVALTAAVSVSARYSRIPSLECDAWLL